ncbi:MAG: PAS domain S-box protein [Verrucomicrobia bacterium]|nr:PAS domain S-box protein [Verrucomicrobiota bacterium]
MRRFSQLSLQHKINTLALGASLLVVIVASATFFVRERVADRETVRQMLLVRAAIMGESLTVALDFNDPRPVQEALNQMDNDPGMIRAAAYDSQGRLVASYQRKDVHGPTQADAPPPGDQFVGDVLHLALPITVQGRTIGTIYFQRDMLELRAHFTDTFINIGVAALFATALGFLVSAAIQRIVSNPILNLARTSQSVAISHDFSIRAVKANDDEIGELVDRFNGMLTELQSHDNALAAARGELEERVVERTRQLSETLARLQAEVRDREAAQQALHRAQEKLFLHMAQTPMAVIDWNTQFEVVSWNPAAERIFGYPAAEAIGRRGSDLIIPPVRHPLVDTLWKALLRSADGEHVIKENTTRDGRTITCEWFNTPLVGADGQVIGVSSFCSDISDRVNLEQQLRQSQKMQAIGQLAAGVAHDFNNLLTIIKGNTSLLEFNPKLSVEDRGYIKELHDASNRAATLVSQLLAFSRKQVLQPKPLDLNELVASDAKMLTRLLGETIVLRCTFAPTPVMVHADRGMMDQIIINLAVNGRDAMPDQGQLDVSTELITVDATSPARSAEARPGEFSCLGVTDTGCGMDAATQARIFEPFFTTKEVGKGTGLGLATVYGIVKQHDGWIECTSSPGRGTTFKVFLPHHAGGPENAASASEGDAALRGTETVLLVEDEPALRDFIRRSLTRLGYHVLVAASGPDTLPVWQEHRASVQLLVTDMVMPGGMTGLELAARLRQDRPDLRVIYSSGYSPDLFTGKIELKEGLNYLPKPYSMAALGKAVRAALDAK